MDRIKLSLPKKFAFATEIPVRISDINYGGHVGNDTILSLIHEARFRFLTKNGYTELDIDGFSLIMVDSVVVYKSEVFYGQLLKIEVTAGKFSDYGFDFIYRITNKETGKEAARAKTGMVFFDYEKKRVIEVPEQFKLNFDSKY
ncbi:MAG: thioesterase family protein [Thermodesulfobacteriota bacterium]|nr:thioesterase family protein [Thermodesulfobacteriota bacterium]